MPSSASGNASIDATAAGCPARANASAAIARRRHADVCREASRLHTFHESRDELRAAAEQAQASADLRHPGGGRHQAHRWREAERERRELRKRRLFRRKVARLLHELGRKRVRGGQQHLLAQPGGTRGVIQRDDARHMPAAVHDERPRVHLWRPGAREDVQRERWESERGPEHPEISEGEGAKRASGTRQDELVDNVNDLATPRYLGSQIPDSDNPISARSSARRCASFAQKNSSSCGGLTVVPASIACTWPRWWI